MTQEVPIHFMLNVYKLLYCCFSGLAILPEWLNLSHIRYLCTGMRSVTNGLQIFGACCGGNFNVFVKH